MQHSAEFTQTYTRLQAHTHKWVRKFSQILTAKRESAAIIMLMPLKTNPITIIGGFVCSWHHSRNVLNHYIYTSTRQKLKRFGSFMEILNNFSRLGTEDARRRNTVADRSCLFFCDLAASPTLRARSSKPCRSQLVRCCHPATLKSKFL